MPVAALLVPMAMPTVALRARLGPAVAMAALVLAPLAAVGEPLPTDTCEALIEERALLEGGGAGENIARGVEWGKTNLTAEQMTYVKRLIAVREAVVFRCRSFEIVREPSPPGTAAEAAASLPAAVPPPTRKSPADSAPSAGKTAAPAGAEVAKPASAKPASAKPASAEPSKPAAAKKSAKPRQEAAPRPAKSDAYVPPEGSQSTLKVPAGVAPAPQQQ